MTVSFTFDPGAPASSRCPSNADMSRVGRESSTRTKSPGRMPAFAAGESSRAETTRKIVLMRQDDADIGRAGLIAALDLTHLLRREVGAVGVEPFGETAHRAAHHAVHVGLLDVVAHDERHDVLEHPQVRVGIVGARHRVAEEPADDREGDDGRRDENGDQPCA